MKSLLKTRESKSDAAVTAMKTVMEEHEGESSRESGSLKHSSTGYTPQDESSESFQLAKKETQYIKYSKYLVVTVIFALAIVTSLLTFFFVKALEHSDYKTRFEAIAKEVTDFSRHRAHNIVRTTERLGVHITSAAETSGQKWPFVTIDDFQVKGMLANEDSGAHTMQINPLVFPQDLEQWSNYSVEHQGWIKEAHYYDKHVDEELYVMAHYDNEDDDSHTSHEDPSLRWDVMGVTPYVWTTEETEKWDPTLERIPVGEQIMYVPNWQRAPACDLSPQVNMDLHSDPIFGQTIEAMLAVDHAVFTRVVDATYLRYNYEHRFDPKEQEEPHSFLLEPIYDTLLHNRTAVAVLAAFLRWGTFFDNVLPEHERGIFVVMESSCGQKFTYEIVGEKAIYIGEGDHHQKRLDLEVKFELSRATQSEEGLDENHHLCHYYAHIFPAQEWKDQFYTSRPYVFAAFVAICFGITTLVFIIYDWLVQRRQKMVMKAAKRTDAIVKSLFPANVRDRLLEDMEESNLPKPSSRPSWSDPSMSFAQKGKDLDGSHKHNEMSSEAIFGSKPIADLFPETTIMFADMVGFTAWSSVRDPQQVFSLLETVYHSFDRIAKRRRVFKVETVGDCYVAVSGLPMPRKEHAIVMCKFASDCVHKMKEMVHSLETTLGPDTADLDIRVGLHSGPVTAGVLRGEKGRFQLFGDTMNTASRLESTGCAGRIHISRDTSEILVASGKEKWVTQREDRVFAKGKGTLQTYWMRIINESCGTAGTGSQLNSTNGAQSNASESGLVNITKHLTLGHQHTYASRLPDKVQRLVSWNADILVKILRQIVARRGHPGKAKDMEKYKKALVTDGTVLDEVQDVLALPQFDIKTFENQVDPGSIHIPQEVVFQMNEMLARIALLYQNNPFHNFEHASHVTMSVSKLLSRIINPIEVSSKDGTSDQLAADLHDHTFGITSDPLTQFACVISALIHDADHPGVPNNTLVKEEDPLASKYNNKSVAEQNSVDLAWSIIMSEEYKELQAYICGTKSELLRFRSIIVNVVMATDIMDKDLGAKRKARWDIAFAEEEEEKGDTAVAINRKATIVLEHLMQASDVAHTMQHWVVYKKWNERLFNEMYTAYCAGRSDKDPSESWYNGELGFFDYYIIPLAKKLEACGVFGVSSQEYLNYAVANRREWEVKGQQLVKDYLERFHNNAAKEERKGERAAMESFESFDSVVAPAAKMEMAPIKTETGAINIKDESSEESFEDEPPKYDEQVWV